LAELEEGPEPKDADRRWLAVEYALAALATDGREEAYHLLREADVLHAVADSDHPDAAVLSSALADLVAAGGPPVPVYQLKIVLRRVRPAVWRRVRLPATTTLDALHEVIQVVFDWDDDHLHVFTVDGQRYADPYAQLDDCADEARVRLGRVLPRAGDAMRYVYDLGDWGSTRSRWNGSSGLTRAAGSRSVSEVRVTRRRRIGFPAAAGIRPRSTSA
jgi:hypothetical protein